MKRVKDVMIAEVETLDPLETVQSAALKMKACDYGLMPVCESGRLVGTLTDRDITVRVTAEGRDASCTSVRDVMSRDVVVASELQDLHEAAELMRSRQIRRLPVVDRQKKLVGLLSLSHLAIEEEGLTGEVLRGIVQPRAR